MPPDSFFNPLWLDADLTLSGGVGFFYTFLALINVLLLIPVMASTWR